MSKAIMSTGSALYRHQKSLQEDLLATGPLRTKPKKRKAKRDGDDAEAYVDSKRSQKILKIGQELAEEDRWESQVDPLNLSFTVASRFSGPGEQDNEHGSDEETEEAWVDEDDELPGSVDDAELDLNDLNSFNNYIPAGEEPTLDLHAEKVPERAQGTDLAQLILQAIEAKEAGEGDHSPIFGGGAPEDAIEIPAKVVEVYTKVGMILSRYKSGKLPKPFKIIATLPHWEDLLAITRPNSWTPNACYEATRIFVSSNSKVAQGFIESVLLERVREDIHETKKLNVHLYKALKKATYKPAAFFKGLLFPLIESGTCTLREARVISSVITRVSIPSLHSAAALMRLTDIAAEQASVSTEGGGATNIFIRALLEKKYALPYKVIDNLVFHFLRFRAVPKEASTIEHSRNGLQDFKLPVLWHQSLLAFAQRYRNDITEDQREALLDLLLVEGHREIGPEVRRELLEGRGRGIPIIEPPQDGGDDTMVMDPT